MSESEAAELRWLAERFTALRDTISTVVIGQDPAIRLCFASLVCGGHSLIEGPPGVAKTLLVRSLAGVLGIRFGRVQFTPDLMPSDVIGTPVYYPDRGEFTFRPGPIFTDALLADEINRAPAKTQAAMLEAMQERAATVDGERHELGEFFTVFATQNPVEHAGTYPLPEAELDRFLFKITLDYPGAEDELRIFASHHRAEPTPDRLEPIMTAPDILRARRITSDLAVEDDVLAYVRDLVRTTREDPRIALGASPRAGLWLVRAAKVSAALEGRDYVLPEDVQDAFLPVLRHRIVLEPSVEVTGQSAAEVLTAIARAVAAPH